METLVTCALCDLLGSNDGNFVPNTDEAKKDHARIHFTQLSKISDIDDGTVTTEDEIFHRCCFTMRQPKVEQQEAPSEIDGFIRAKIRCRQLWTDLCRQLFEKVQSNSASPTTVCNVCGVGIRAKLYSMDPLIKHAFAHLEVKLFKCRHCYSTMRSSRGSIAQHIRQVHDIIPTEEDIEDKTTEHFEEISDQIKRCYSTEYPRASELRRRFVLKGGCRGKSNQSVNDFCRSIYIQRSMPVTLECNVCGLVIKSQGASRGDDKCFKAAGMFDHAAAHLEVKLFNCLHCDRSMSTKRAMVYHLTKAHRVTSGTSENFDDLSETYRSEHFDMIERCFSANQVKLEESATSTKDKSMTKVKAAMRKSTTDSRKLAIERLLLCKRLVRKRIDSDGKIKCSLCLKRQVAKCSAGREVSNSAIQHVEAHLQLPLYRCNICKSAVNTQTCAIYHLKLKHALGLEKNYEHAGDEFHKEIMDMLSACYGHK